jgi:hypothetical protein
VKTTARLIDRVAGAKTQYENRPGGHLDKRQDAGL